MSVPQAASHMIDPSGACRRINEFRTKSLILHAQLTRPLEMKYTFATLQNLTLDASHKRTPKISIFFLNSNIFHFFRAPKMFSECMISPLYLLCIYIGFFKLNCKCDVKKNNRLYLRAAKELGAHIHRFCSTIEYFKTNEYELPTPS